MNQAVAVASSPAAMELAGSVVEADGPRSRDAWFAVLSISISASVFCTTEFMPVGLLRFISAGLAVPPGLTGVSVTVPGLLAAISAPVLTVAVGTGDRRKVLIGLGALLLASNVIGMLAPNFAVLIFGRTLFGIGLGGFWAIGAGLGSRLVQAKFAARATSIIFAGVSIGMLIGGAAGALLGALFGWRSAFGLSAGLSALALVAQVVWLPKLRVSKPVRAEDLLGLFSTPTGKVGLTAMAFALCAQFATYTFITPFLASQTGLDGKAISSILLGYTLIGLVGNFASGALAAKSLRTTLLVSIGLLASTLVLLPTAGQSRGATLMALALWGLAYGAMPVALQIWMVRAAPRAHESAMALFVSNFQASIAVGSLLGGVVVDHLGINDAMYVGGISALLALLIVGRAPEIRSQHDGRRPFSTETL
jgi:predicted MFS family arabinose efflux permease